MSKAFDDWLDSLYLRPEECISLNLAYNAGRAYQREVDASYVLSLWGGRYTCVEVTIVAKVIREQKIDD